MRFVTILGIILIVLGTAGLIWGGIDLTMDRQVAEVGPVEVEAETTERVAIPFWAAGAIFAGGLVLVGIGSRKK